MPQKMKKSRLQILRHYLDQVRSWIQTGGSVYICSSLKEWAWIYGEDNRDYILAWIAKSLDGAQSYEGWLNERGYWISERGSFLGRILWVDDMIRQLDEELSAFPR